MVDLPVIIAGAGPVGLSAAAYLIKQGIPVKVFESEPKLPENLRASTFHPPTLDMLAAFGASQGLIEQGLIAPKFQFRDRAGCLAEFDFGILAGDTEYPFRVQCEQFKLNHLLFNWLQERGGADVHFNHAITNVRQYDDKVAAFVDTPDGEKLFEGRWLIGAEGANSVVRQTLNIPFEGFTWDERFLVVSTPFSFELVIPDLSLVNYFADPEQWFFLLKVPGMWRVMFPTQPDESEDEIFDPATIERRMQWVHGMPESYQHRHITLYRVHQRVAKNNRKGRVFIAGDAAHINNPLGGMGMNGGIHDSLNLAEKISAVWHGEKPETYLALYEAQRRPIALDYVNTHTIRNKQNLEAKTPEDRKAFRDFLANVASDRDKTREYLLRTSMITSLREASEIRA